MWMLPRLRELGEQGHSPVARQRRPRVATVQVPLPSELWQRVRQAIPSEAALGQVLAEAVQLWLEPRRAEKRQHEQGVQLLRHAGLAMEAPRQRALAETLLSPLRPERTPSRDQGEAALSRLHVPLSEEIMARRGEANADAVRL